MKKAQAAMEFLMTYGWVILVVLVGISALAYFGVLNPGDNLPDTCFLFPGLGCNDFKIDSSGVTLIVTNGGGINIEKINFTVSGNGPCGGDSSAETSLNDGETKTFVITCSSALSSGSSFREDIKVAYKETDGLEHLKTGSITAKVE